MYKEKKPVIYNALSERMYESIADDKVRSMQASIMPYVIKNMSEDEAEITMYGEVVQKRPVDFWTGKPVEGLYIVLADFIKDLEQIGGMKKITVHINSPGGDADSGRAIYNRLSEMENVTTVCDSMAASAASIIFMAGKNRRMFSGSQLMIHDASVFLFGDYQSGDLEETKGMLDSYDDAIAEIYASRTGITKQKISNMMKKTTWMSASEAVEQGFATEIIGGTVADIKMTADRKYIVCNKIPIRVPAGMKLPAGIQEIADMGETMMSIDNNINMIPEEGGEAAVQPEHEVEGGMIMTLKQLKEEHPELCEQIRTEGKNEGVTEAGQKIKDAVAAERQRIRDIESIEASIADKELIREAKYGENPMDAKDLAFAAMQKQAALGNAMLNAMRKDAKDSGAMDVHGIPAEGMEGNALNDSELDDFVKNALEKGGNA